MHVPSVEIGQFGLCWWSGHALHLHKKIALFIIPLMNPRASSDRTGPWLLNKSHLTAIVVVLLCLTILSQHWQYICSVFLLSQFLTLASKRLSSTMLFSHTHHGLGSFQLEASAIIVASSWSVTLFVCCWLYYIGMQVSRPCGYHCDVLNLVQSLCEFKFM